MTTTVAMTAATAAPARTATLAGRVATALFAIDLALALAYLLIRSTGHLPGMLGLDTEPSIPTWYASTKLFVLAQVLALAGWLRRPTDRVAAGLFLLLAGLALLLSIDEIAQIHETYGLVVEPWLLGHARSELLLRRTGYWMVALGVPLALLLACLLWVVARRVRVPLPIAVRGVAGLVVFLGSATVLEAIGNFAYGDALRALQVTLEEGGEMMGVTLLVWAALGLVAETWPPRDSRWR